MMPVKQFYLFIANISCFIFLCTSLKCIDKPSVLRYNPRKYSMSYTLKNKENKAVFTITIPLKEVEKGMRTSAESMSKETKIPGFRPGKASYEVVKKRIGEVKLLENAAETLVRDAFLQAMLAENLDTVGQPFFTAEKMAPGNDLIFKVEIALFPHVTKLADYKELSVKKQSTKPTKETIERAKKDLVLMQTKEVRKEKEKKLEKGDKVVVNLTMKKDDVVLEGGEGQDHGIYTSEPYYIDGFIDKIIGAKEEETRDFILTFPSDHFQKHLAGAEINFSVQIKEIFALEAPKIDDTFAKALGLTDVNELEEKLSENLQNENEAEEKMRQEKEVMEAIIAQSTFDAVPDILINQEINRMIHELEHSIKSRGMTMDDYLGQIGRGLAELKLDFTPTALKRIQSAIIIKEIAKDKTFQVEEGDIDAQIDKIADQYKDNKDAMKKVHEPEYRDYVAYQMTNKLVLDHLRETIVK